MPSYDLRCTDCNNEFQTMSSMSDRAERRIPCPECGSHELEVVYKSAPVYFKGKKSKKTDVCPSSHSCGVDCPHRHL